VKFLIVSLGSIGRRHARNLRQLYPAAQIAALRQPRTLPAPPPPEVDVEFFSMEDAILFAPHAAIVAGPAVHHVPASLALVRAGIPVLVEKPLGSDLTGVASLVSESRMRGVAVMVGYNLRFLPSMRELKQRVRAGDLGRIHGVRIDVGQYLPDWRPGSRYEESVSARRELGGGVLLELSHDIDYLLWIFGMPARVHAVGGIYSDLQLDVEDQVDLLLEYDNPRMLASVHLDFLQRPAGRSCRIQGTEGTLRWDGLNDTLDLYLAAQGQWRNLVASQGKDRNEMYLEELRQFMHCIETRSLPPVDVTEGADVLKVVDAARNSMRSGSSVLTRD
jgi:predicted dehydrogenase